MMSTAALLTMKMQTLSEQQQKRVLEFIQELPAPPPSSRPSLYGLFKGFDTTEDEIAEARREMWGSFPREDF